jgi:flagellar biosynthesis GTPase FlhF
MTQAPVSTEQPPVTTPPAAAQTTEPVAENTIPYTRFKEVNDQLAELKRKDQEREDKERKEAEKRAKESGQFKELVDQKDAELTALKPQLQTAQEQRDTYAAAMEEQMKARVKALPAELAAMLPEGDVLARYKALGLAEAAAAKLSIARSPGTPAGPTGSGGTAGTAPLAQLRPGEGLHL